MTTPAQATVDADRLDPSVWKIAAVAALGSLLSQLDATIVNVSLSTLVTDLHSTLSTIQWVTSGYLLALTLVLPLNGWLVDRIGARAVYLGCISAFTLSSALCGIAWSAGSLIGFRLLQGMSGGLLAPMAQMMIARAAGRHMARVAGYAVAPVLLAPLLGPVIAGAILKYASWRWLFLVNLPVGVVALLLAWFFLPGDRDETTRRTLDWVGLALLSPGLACLLYGSERLGSAAGKAALAASVVLLAAFVWVARRKGDRALIRLRLFRSPVFSAAAVTQFLSNGVLYAGQVLIPLYLLDACGFSPSHAGWLLTPLGIGMMVAYPSTGALTKRFGIRRLATGGALLAFAATLPLAWLALHGFDPVVLFVALFLRGMGQSTVGLPSMAAAYASVNRQDLPMATTSLNIVQRLGGPAFTTVMAAFLAWRLEAPSPGQATSAAFAFAFLLLGGLHALTALSALRLPLKASDVEG